VSCQERMKKKRGAWKVSGSETGRWSLRRRREGKGGGGVCEGVGIEFLLRRSRQGGVAKQRYRKVKARRSTPEGEGGGTKEETQGNAGGFACPTQVVIKGEG